MDTTLILLKPDCVNKKLIGEVIGRFERAGFVVAAMKMLKLDSATLREHYAHVADKPFYPEIESFMSSGPVVAMAVRGAGVIDKVREISGPTDSKKAPKGTIRGDLGEDVMVNVVHASDSAETAAVELRRFFKDGEIF